jgi:Tetracyclin repressor-like, C-terminal domain
MVHAFIRSECEEARTRGALNDAAPLYRDAPEVKQARASGDRTFQNFMREALPGASKATRELAGDMIKTTFSAFGQRFSETPRGDAEIEVHADALADMLCAYIESLRKSKKKLAQESRRAHAVAGIVTAIERANRQTTKRSPSTVGNALRRSVESGAPTCPSG